MPGTPAISVVVSTRGRAESAARCVASILRNRQPACELLVVDQSPDGSTETALSGLRSDPRLVYFRGGPEGLSAGRNLAIRRARSELIACTDDDCEVPSNWLGTLVAALRQDDRTAVVFGNTLPGPHDRMAGFIPACVRGAPFLARSLREQHRVDGMAACMGLRRRAWEQLGGFDESLGSGAPFRAGEEMDFAIRALQAGFWVRTAPEVEVTHHGFRTWQEGNELIEGYLFGLGAMLAKHLKCGRWSILHFLLQLFWRWAFTGPVVDLGRRPSRWLRLRAFLSGTKAGFVQPVDRRNLVYRAARG